MSWAEVFKINNNMKKSLNEQMRDMKYNPMRVITSSMSYTPEKTGLYKVICVGAGGNSVSDNDTTLSDAHVNSGGAGGVAIKTIRLIAGTSYSVTVSTTASFGTELTATAGQTPSNSSHVIAAGGIASGGDFNYTGGTGNRADSVSLKETIKGGDVGVFISDLYRENFFYDTTSDTVGVLRYNGASILGYGGGASTTRYKSSSGSSYLGLVRTGLPAAVIIIPIEMEG